MYPISELLKKKAKIMVDEPELSQMFLESQNSHFITSSHHYHINEEKATSTSNLESLSSTEEPLRASESTTSETSSLLQQASMPIVNTLPGYNILRLLTGG
jgi:hypothetical protein